MTNVQGELYAICVVCQYYLNPVTLELDYSVPAMPIAMFRSEFDAKLFCERYNRDYGVAIRFYGKFETDYKKVECKCTVLPFE